MSFEKKLSIIVTVYDARRTLTRCINSILSNSTQDIEVILVDDGSKDGSSELCDKYINKYDYIRGTHLTNGGVSRARNHGIEMAKGEFITFIDSDDYVDSEYVNELLRVLEQSPQLVLFEFNEVKPNFKAKKTTSDSQVGIKLRELTIQDAFKLIMQDSRIQGYVWNKAFRTDILLSNNVRFDEVLKVNEDLLFCYSYLKFCQRPQILAECLYNYVESEGSAVHSRLNKSVIEGLRSYGLMLDEAPANHLSDKEYIHVAYIYMNWYLLKSGAKRGYTDIDLISQLLLNIKRERFQVVHLLNLEVRIATFFVNLIPEKVILSCYKLVPNGIQRLKK